MKNYTLTLLKSALAVGLVAVPLLAQSTFNGFAPGNIVVSRSVYTGTAATVAVGQSLPPVCPATATCPTTKATDNGAYPVIGSTNNVFNNTKADGSFGVTSPIFLDQYTPAGTLVNTYAVDSSKITTSFPSKSEVAVNLSTDGTAITFMGYPAPPNTLDVSNSNTPGVIDPTNPVGGTNYFRSVAQINAAGVMTITNTNAYSGNNGRAAILAGGQFYMVGNSNNGSGTPTNVTTSTGVEIATPGQPDTTVPTQIGDFSITNIINPATGKPYGTTDKAGKDNNFRGLTVFNNTVYVTKGSGSNGINTVYQVGTAGTLPTLANASTTALTILPGFPTTLARNADASNPFGLFFANATTLYVSDEGDGTTATAATSSNSGIQKWILVNGVWQRVYVLQNGLGLGQTYSIANYPPTLNPMTGGIRNITGRVNPNGTVTIWGVTSTVSANGDQGADPNKLVMITDILANTSPTVAGSEQFSVVKSALAGEVLRGVSFTPGTTPATLTQNAAIVISSANAGTTTLAPNSIASAFANDLANTTPAPVLPLPTTLGGSSISIVDSTSKTTAVPLISESPMQATFLVPAGVATGTAQLTFTSGDGTKSTATVQIAPVAPGVFTLNGGGLAAADVVRVSSTTGLQTFEQTWGINAVGALVANPIRLGTDQVYLVLFGTGLRAAATGTVTVSIGGKSVPVLYSGAQSQFAGLDQINVQIPASLAGSGVVPVQVSAGSIAANPVNVTIQ